MSRVRLWPTRPWFLLCVAVALVLSAGAVSAEISFQGEALPDGASTDDRWVVANVSVMDSSVVSFTWYWDGDDYALFDDDLVLLFNFDEVVSLGESDSVIVDVTGHGFDGSWAGVPDADSGYNPAGVHGGAWYLDGDDPSIDVPGAWDAAMDGASSWAVALWVFAESDTANILNAVDGTGWIWVGDDYRVGLHPDFYNLPGDGYSTPNDAVDEGGWTHLVITRDGTDIRVYKNGVLFDTLTALEASNDDTSDTDLRIARYDGGESRLEGRLDEFYLFGRSLSSEEAWLLYRSSLRRLGSGSWEFFVNQTDVDSPLDYGTYSYKASYVDGDAVDSTGLRTVTITADNPGCGDIACECASFGYDYAIAKWEWEDGWAPEGDANGTSVTGNDTVAYYDAGRTGVPGVFAVVVKAGSTEHYAIEGNSGVVGQDKPAISHLTFCGDYPVGGWCGDGVVDEDEECDDGNAVDGDGCSSSCEVEPFVIKAYKVVCEQEGYLPDWGLAGVQPGEPAVLDGDTAADYVAASDGHCWLESGWSFQWGYANVPKLDGDFIGPALTGPALDEWKDFDSVTASGPAVVEIYDLEGSPRMWVRENLQEGYVPFVNPPGDLQDPVSAEMYCGNDVLNFDNYDWLANPSLGETRHCVAFNALDPYCGDGVVNGDEECDGEPYCSEGCTYLDLSCVEAKGLGLLSGSISGGSALVVNDGPHDYDVGFAVYEKFDEVIDNQVLFDSDSGVAPAFGNITLGVDLPDCNYQVDFFCGPVIPDLSEEWYGDRKIAFEHVDMGSYCVEGFCGDGVLQEGEECDLNGANGVACVPPYGGSCTYCSASCENVTLQGPYCGDGVVNGDEECDGEVGVSEGYSCTPECMLEGVPGCLDVSFTGPYFSNASGRWIDTASRVGLVVNESLSACVEADHYYRFHAVEDSYCLGACGEWMPGGDGWSSYDGPFALPSESCYVIEHYSDTAHGDSPIGWECVFVDKSAPVIGKSIEGFTGPMSVGDRVNGAYFYPLLDPDGADYCAVEGHCWEVSKDSEVVLSCDDPGDYPSGVDELCFTVDFDGDDLTADYCDGALSDGWCCVGQDSVGLSFMEDSWHELNVTCRDNVNKSSSDLEYFKVGGGSFDLVLNKKWNLVSTPITLFQDDPGAVFGGVEEVAGVWAYNASADAWRIWRPGVPSNLEHVIPGEGYWVLTTGAVNVSLYGSEYIHPYLKVPIVHGWNLIGYFGTEGSSSFGGYAGVGLSASCALAALSEGPLSPGFASIWGYWEPFADKWLKFGPSSHLDPGAGYWLFASRDGLYAPSTMCVS